jgi:hypothetical protein|tara:strand:- start:38 stop:253 length:216 start_codon:yes stop_codon:yes gene_type:complete
LSKRELHQLAIADVRRQVCHGALYYGRGDVRGIGGVHVTDYMHYWWHVDRRNGKVNLEWFVGEDVFAGGKL